MAASNKAALIVVAGTAAVLAVGFTLAPMFTASALGYGIGAYLFNRRFRR